MKRIALFPVLFAALVSAASAEPSVSGKPDRIFVSVQLDDGQSSLPISSLTIANGATGAVYVENNLPYVERAEKARAQTISADAIASDAEDGITMMLTPTVAADGQIDVEFTIRKAVQMDPNGDAAQPATTEVRHKAVVRNGLPSTIEIDAAPAEDQTAAAAEAGPAYTVKLVAQKI